MCDVGVIHQLTLWLARIRYQVWLEFDTKSSKNGFNSENQMKNGQTFHIDRQLSKAIII